jgi:hypothetical protein
MPGESRTDRHEALVAAYIRQRGGMGKTSPRDLDSIKTLATLTIRLEELDEKYLSGRMSPEDDGRRTRLLADRRAMYEDSGLTTTNANQPTVQQDESARAALARSVDGIRADHKRKEVARLAAAKPEPLQMLDGEDFTDVLLRRLADFGVFVPDGASLDGQVIAPRPRLVEAVNHDPENPESRNQGGARDYCASPSTLPGDGPAGTKEATPSPNQALDLRKQTPTEQLTPQELDSRRTERLFQEHLHGPYRW